MSSTATLDDRHYIGIGCLLVASVLFFYWKKAYNLFFGITLFAGLFGFIDFHIATVMIGFLGFMINPIFLVLIVLYALLNDDIKELLLPKDEPSASVDSD